MWWNGTYGPGNWGGWGMMHGGFSLLILAAFILGVMLLARLVWGNPRRQAGADRPAGLSMLEERYARGEIEREEYLQKKHDLGF